VNSGDATSASISGSAARFIALDDSKGLLAGVMLSWHNTFSGDNSSLSQTVGRNRNQPNGPRGGQNGGQAGQQGSGISSIAGDDNYGQLSFYLSYDLTPAWSVDIDTGFDLGTDTNEQVWSVGVGYYW
jgi:hypothetical protein